MVDNMKAQKFNSKKFRESLNAQQFYVKELRKLLPNTIYKPRPSKLIWLSIHYVFISFLVFQILNSQSWGVNIVLSVLIGHSLGIVGFLGHEINHGAVVRNKKAIALLGSVCFAHWGLHSKAWMNQHNRLHHKNTQDSCKDPDCFGRIQYYKYSRKLKNMELFLPGSGSLLSYTFLFWWFSFHTIYIVWFNPYIFNKSSDKIISQIFMIAVYSCWLGISISLHPFGFLFFFLIPIFISNFLIMSYIVTNHFLNPLTEDVNDPLVNSLTVDTPALIRFLHLNFNYHVEHHLFPSVNPHHAPVISKLLKERYPNKYQHMSHLKAIRLIYQRPKFYYDEGTLIHPKNKRKYPAIFLDDLI